jgi:O-antigen ligase
MNGTTSLALNPVCREEDKPVRLSIDRHGAQWAYGFLWLFTVAVYARPEDIFPSVAQLHLTFVFGCCAGLAFLAALLFRHVYIQWTKELGIILVLTAWYAIGVLFALWRGGSAQILAQVWLKTLVIFFLLTQTLVTRERIRLLLWAIILSELVVTGYSVLDSSAAAWTGGRLAGLNQGILGWNFLGIAAAITIPYIGALFVVQRSLLRSCLLAGACLSMLWMLILTASRGGLLSVVFSVALTLLLVFRGSFRGRLIGVGIVGALTLVISMAPTVFWQRLDTVWGSADIYTDKVAASAQESAEDHVAVLVRSIQYTLDHPIFGLGLGNFQVASGTELRRPDAWMGTHNTFTQISSEAGLPALFLFVGLLITAVRSMARVDKVLAVNQETLETRMMARATLASLLAFAFGAFFVHLAYEYFCFYPLAIAVGVQHVSRQMASEGKLPAAKQLAV